jgi:hypothetical protein
VNREGARPALPGLSLLFWVATGLVVVASWQLFVLSGLTDRFFAWKIALPLTAAIDGAFYLAAVILLVSAARAQTWSEVRHVAWGVLTISTLKLAATLIHYRLFHFDHGQLTARIAAWGWLVVYAVVPIALVLLIWAELRTPGVDPPPAVPMPRPFRWLAGFLALALVAIGLGLFFSPASTAEHWPWGLTPLTSRDLGAWFVGIGVVGGVAVLYGDLVRSRPVWIGSVALAVLQGVALARYSDSVDWGSATAWLYVALFAAVGISGVWGWRGSVGAQR